MHKKLLLLAVVLLSLQGIAQDIILLHTNDLHSKLNGYSPETEYTPEVRNDDNTRGGFARIAGLINQEREANKNDIVLTVDAGDFLMGSLFHPLEDETGFQLSLMKKMGYDYMTLGNHEFDYGPGTLAQIINKALEKGEIPQLLLSNIKFSENDPEDDELAELYNQGVIKPYAIHKEKGVRIAFLGIIGYDAEEVQPYLTPVKLTDPKKAVKHWSKKIMNENLADIVVVLSHSGVEMKKGKWTGEDVNIAKKSSKYISAIISGHTHTEIKDQLIIKNVPIVQTGSGGKNLGKLTLQKQDNNFIFKSHKLMPINDQVIASTTIQYEIDNQKKQVQKLLLDPLNLKYNSNIVETSFDLKCDEIQSLENSTLGPLVAEAIQDYTINAGYHSDISLIAAGLIRDHMRQGVLGIQNISDIFRILSLGEGQDDIPGYPITQVHVTAKEIKSVIEVLLMAQKTNKAAYCYYAGARITIDMNKGFLNKVVKIELGDDNKGWTELDFSRKNKKLYTVTSNIYMLNLMRIIKQESYGLVNVKPKDKNGNPIKDANSQILDFDQSKPGVQEGKEWMALHYYVLKFPDSNGNTIPDIPIEYKTRFNPIIMLTK